MDYSVAKTHYFGRGDLAILITGFLWGLGAVVVKAAIGTSPETFRIYVFNGLRLPIVSLLLFIAVKLRGMSIGLQRRHVPFVAAIAFFGIFLNTVTAITGLSMSSASNMGIIVAVNPLFILFISFVTGIERATARLCAGIFIGMSGVAVINFQKGGYTFNFGDILIVISCIFFAIYAVFGKKIVNEYSSMLTATWLFFFASLYQLPLFVYQLRAQTWGTISPVNWLNFGFGIFGSFFAGNVLFFYAIKRIGSVRAGLYLNLQPVFTLLMAYVLIGESITVMKITGLMVVLVGIWITQYPVRTKPIAANTLIR